MVRLEHLAHSHSTADSASSQRRQNLPDAAVSTVLLPSSTSLVPATLRRTDPTSVGGRIADDTFAGMRQRATDETAAGRPFQFMIASTAAAGPP
jgi:hypothetical protein